MLMDYFRNTGNHLGSWCKAIQTLKNIQAKNQGGQWWHYIRTKSGCKPFREKNQVSKLWGSPIFTVDFWKRKMYKCSNCHCRWRFSLSKLALFFTVKTYSPDYGDIGSNFCSWFRICYQKSEHSSVAFLKYVISMLGNSFAWCVS